MSQENKLITGYQWGTDNIFIGEYQFPNNLDAESVYLPPNTTLVAPPAFDITVHKAIWNGKTWVLERLPEPVIEKVVDIELDEITVDTQVKTQSTKKTK